MGIKKLTAENAVIKTASVEVKTLTISGKQVTLAVFRQLPERSIIRWTNGRPTGLLGVAWGRVNYHPDKCDSVNESCHFHIVWQDGETLYRHRVEHYWGNAWDADVGGRNYPESLQSLMDVYGQLIEPLLQLDQLYIAV